MEVMWSIMASFMLYVVDKYVRDFYMELSFKLVETYHLIKSVFNHCIEI